MASFSIADAQSYGNPAKTVRMPSLQRVVRDSDVVVVREPVEELAAPVIDATATAPTPEVKPAAPVERAKKRGRVVALSKGPYLPVTGALPLRYSSIRKWPAPMPTGEAPAEELLPRAVATASDPDETPAADASETANNAASPATATVATGPSSRTPPKPDAAKPEPTILTADMILGYLGNLPATDSRVSVRFEPAIPQGASLSTGGTAAFTP